MSTKIPWTNETWPVVTGCTHAGGPGCDNCYAARMAATRLRDHPRYKGLAYYHNGKARWTGKVNLNHDVLGQPLHWRKPRMILVASMGDLFHPCVPIHYISSVFEIINQSPRHIFQILTKRPQRMLEYVQWWEKIEGCSFDLKNAWLGTSVENQATADERIPQLLQVPAAVIFVSVEPMLGQVNLSPWLSLDQWLLNPLNQRESAPATLDWIICGGESGPGARPMDEDWVRSLRDQCQSASVSFFYKQAIRNGCRVHMPELDGRVWDEFPVSKPG